MRAVDPPRERIVELGRIPIRLALGSYQAEILGWGFLGRKSWRNWLHTHSFYEICYVFAGHGRFTMLGVDHRVQRGQVFIAKPGEEHEIVSSRSAPLGIYFWSYTLVPAVSPGADPAVDRLLGAFIASRRWVSSRVPGMGRTLELLTEEAARGEAGRAAAVAGLVGKLILDTARATLEAPLPADPVVGDDPTGGEAVVAQAQRYVTDNLSRPLSVRDIAAQARLSERHFSRLFRRRTGASPLEWLVDRRIEAAAQLLLDRRLAIKDIAARVGFADVRYFTTVFRQRTGTPPAAFRAQGGTRFADPMRDWSHHHRQALVAGFRTSTAQARKRPRPAGR